MTELSELLEQIADAPSQPSRMIGDEIYTAGRRQYRRRRSIMLSGVVTMAVAVIAAIGLTTVVTSHRGASGVAPGGQSTSNPGDTHHAGESIQWAGAGDAQHLYLAFLTCHPVTTACPKEDIRLVASDDGGHTWTDRERVINLVGLTVIGPTTLIATVPVKGNDSAPSITVDGGRTWSTMTDSPVVPAVPAGGTATCGFDPKPETSCKLQAIDPLSGELAPLATQPELTIAGSAEVTDIGGRLWVGGTDPSSGRPAAAVSTDAGRTWSTRVVGDLPQCVQLRCSSPRLTTSDGVKVYAVITDLSARQRFVYRAAPAGPWQRYGDATSVPYHLGDDLDARSFVTSDGTFVLCQSGSEYDGLLFWTAGSETTAYRQIELPGLSSTVRRIGRTPDGWFFAVDYSNNVLYGSSDGRHWTAVTAR